LPRRERKKQETRRRIYSAAFELFLERGFDETTVEEIAERADVAKGTVFNYFPQKSSFLPAIFEHWVNRITEELGPIEEWSGTTRSKLEQLACFMANLGAESPELFRRAIFEHLRSIPDADGCMRAGPPVQQIVGMIRTVLSGGIEAGDVRSDLNLDHGASLVEAAVFKTLVIWLMENGPFEEVRDEMSGKLDIIFEGVAPRATQAKKNTSRRRQVSE
jgi:AcrR family transcriptional regulator